jgi:hypothetical protein
VTGDDVLLALERGDDAHLLLGVDTREMNVRRIERELELRVRKAPQLLAQNEPATVNHHVGTAMRNHQ